MLCNSFKIYFTKRKYFPSGPEFLKSYRQALIVKAKKKCRIELLTAEMVIILCKLSAYAYPSLFLLSWWL